MAVYHGLNHQYSSLENVMRDKYHRDFADKDASAFEFWFVSDRGRADGSGRSYRLTFDQRRWMSEKLTWERFWPEEKFPGREPPSATEMTDFNAMQQYQQIGFSPNRGRYQGRSRGGVRGYQHHRGRGNMMSPSRGRALFGGGGSPRGNYHGRGRAVQSSQYSFGSFVQGKNLSSFDSDSELISFHDDTISRSQDHSSLITVDTDTQLSDGAQDFNTHTIACRHCGVTGHPEMQCRYQIVIKQGLDRERHLVCGIFGHKAFRFNSYHGCLECKIEREEGTVEKAYGREEAAKEAGLEVATANLLASNKEDEVTGATGAKNTACGWEETNYGDAIEAVRRITSGSFDGPVKRITTGLVVHKLEGLAKLWEVEEVEKGEEIDRENNSEGGDILIHF